MSDLDQRLITAAETGDIAGVQAALLAGVDVVADTSAIRVAATKGRLAVVKLLVSAGANVHVDNDDPLHLAAGNNHMAVVQYLLSAGADIHSANDYALRVAAGRGYLEMVRYLLESGASVDAGNNHALRRASERGHFSVVALLISAGAGVLVENDCPLRFSSGNGHAAVVRLLRAHGARIEAVLAEMPEYRRDVQVALLVAGDVSTLSVIDLASRGICPEALCVLLERQGHGEVVTMISATQMLEPLTPEARADLLGEMLTNPREALAHAGP